jgi:uncharacterized protein YndB with AHSA1/START domain
MQAPDLRTDPGAPRGRIRLERVYKATVEQLWELWTSRQAIENWWGPHGFEVEVSDLDVRPGGGMSYSMTAVAPDQVDFLKKAGMPVSSRHRISITEVVPRRRIAYTELADFIPGTRPYEVTTEVEFTSTPDGARMVLTFDAMHDEHWSRLARMGREMQLEKIERLLAG